MTELPESDAELFARCPHCGAVFRVGQHKLEPRQGEVRCGACREVFNALEYQVFRNAEGLFEDSSDAPEYDDPLTEDSDVAPSLAEEEETTDDAPPAPVDEVLVEEGLETGAPDSEQRQDDPEQADRAVLEDPESVGEPPAAPPIEITPEQPITPVELSVDGPATEELIEADIEVEHSRDHWFAAAPDPQLDNNPFASRTTGTPDADAAEPAPSQFNMRGVDDYIMDRPNPLVSVFWSLICVGFIVLLGLQVKLFFVDRFAQDEQFRPYLGLFCKVAACELPPRRDAWRFTITNTRIDLHPAEPGALRISVKLLNQAKFSQPYPDLQLTLTDRVGRVVGRRSFSPEFYLDQGRGNQLASGELGAVQFDLAQPHEKAVGFVVDVIRS